MSVFVTKENIHETTDLSKIRSLMTNLEQLGDIELKMAEDSNE